MDRYSLTLKYLAGAVLIGILSFFTFYGKVSADVLVAVITAVFGGIGVHVAGKSSASPDVMNVHVKNDSGFVRMPFLFLLSGVACLLLAAACATTTTTSDDTTVTTTTADLTTICTNSTSALTVLSTVATAYDTSTAQTLSDASTVISDLCTSSGTVDATTVATIANTTIPDLITLVQNLSIDTTVKASALTALGLAKVAVNAYLAVLESSSTTSAAALAVLKTKPPLHPYAVQLREAMGGKE